MHLIWSWIRGGQISSCFVSWRQFYACSFDSTLITGKFWNIWSETLPHKLLPFAFTGIALPDSHHVVRQQKLPFGHSHTTLFRWFLFCFQKRINEVMAKLRAPLKHKRKKMAASFSKVCTGGFSCFSSFTSTFTTSSFEPSGADSEPGQWLNWKLLKKTYVNTQTSGRWTKCDYWCSNSSTLRNK